MKKFKLVACAAAVAALAGVNAFAAVDIEAGTGANSYARELVTNGTTFITDDNLDVTHTLGFGVSDTQTRYVRYDLENGTFQSAVVAADFAIAGTVAVVQGGTAGANFVIFQFTATGDLPATEPAGFNLGSGGADGLKVIDKANALKITYQLYETAADAVVGGTAGRLSVLGGKIIGTFAKGLEFTTTLNTTTASVVKLYKEFKNGVTATVAKIGDASLDVSAAVDPDGAVTDVAMFYDTGSKLLLAGDLTAALTSVDKVYASIDDCASVAIAGTSVTAAGAEFVIDANAVAHAICFMATGDIAIPAQTFTLAADLAPVTGTTTGDEGAITLGSFDRDGTILRAAFAEVPAGSFSGTVNLMNPSTNDATFTTSCLTNAATNSRVDGMGGTVKAGQGARFGIGSAAGLNCPANTRGLELIFTVPQGSVIGSVVRQDSTTGQAAFDSMVGSSISPNAIP